MLGGVAGGLGRYFSLDPVLFRVLFATTAVFGGIGALAYVLAWALIPDDNAVDPLADRLLDGLRLRKIPVWLAATAVGILLWIGLGPRIPWGIGPLVIAGAIVAVALSRRTGPAGSAASPDGGPVDAAGTTTRTPNRVRSGRLGPALTSSTPPPASRPAMPLARPPASVANVPRRCVGGRSVLSWSRSGWSRRSTPAEGCRWPRTDG